MFTGIVEELGIVKNIEKRSNLLRLGIAVSFAGKVKIGDSISVNGVCLTATKIEGSVIFFDAVSSTIKTTTINNLKVNDKVNLEQALKAGDRLGGHIVTGHIDTIGAIKTKIIQGDQAAFEITIDRKFSRNIVDKGSVAIDGISLTVSKANNDSFVVNIIPHTLKTTTLGFKREGDKVNIEFDSLGKYASQNSPSKITEDFLRDHGF